MTSLYAELSDLSHDSPVGCEEAVRLLVQFLLVANGVPGTGKVFRNAANAFPGV